MANTHIIKSIRIHATPLSVWRVFTDPKVSRRLGGHYLTDWKKGSSLQWKGDDGKVYTYGIILDIEQEQILKHNLLDKRTKSRVNSVITYRLERNADFTILHAEEELTFSMRDDDFDDALEGWDMVMESIKDAAEKEEK
ncbi:MAG TPA: SRPBCC domain-containing protein [Saprospiraceae bacterium]